MKKISLILLITFVLVLMIAAFASAGGNRYRNFQGVFEMSLRGNGLNSTLGFEQLPDNGFWVPVEGSYVWGSTDTAYGTFVFNRDGTGCASGRNYSFDLPPGNPLFGEDPVPVARNNPFNISFSYDISSDGVIELYITDPPILSEVEMIGKVSKDRRTMTLTNADSPLVFDTHETRFTATRVLIKVLDNMVIKVLEYLECVE